ncbi:MAG: right-handed parallel beta-helix repeat-containing protein [bacterium]
MTDLVVVGGAPGELSLAWTAPGDGALVYEVRTASLGDEGVDFTAWALRGTTSATAMTVAGLAEGTTVVCALRARLGSGPWSEVSNFTVGTAAAIHDVTPPGPVTDLRVWSSTAGTVTVVFAPCGDDSVYGEAAGYEIRTHPEPIDAGNWNAAVPVEAAVSAHSLPGFLKATVAGLEADVDIHLGIVAMDERGQRSRNPAGVPARTVERNTFYVNVEGTGDFSTIEAAMEAAGEGDVVLVGPGRYTWTNQGTGDLKFGLIYVDRFTHDVTLRSLAGPEATILDAEGQGNVITFPGGEITDPVRGVYRVALFIEGFTITGGRALAEETTPDEAWAGGGISFHLTDSVVRDCIFTGNRASQGGGVVFAGQCGGGLENCIFIDNEAKWGGGVMIINTAPRVTITGCDFLNNRADQQGGAFYAYHARFTLQDCLMSGNECRLDGGAVSVQMLNPDCLITGCTLVDNEGVRGSAVRIPDQSFLEIDRSIIAFNRPGSAFSFYQGSNLSLGCTDIFGHTQNFPSASLYVDLGGNLEADPLFADRDGYGLLAASPCLDAGSCGRIGAAAR